MPSGRRRGAPGRAAYAGRTKMPETAELVIDRPPIMPELSDEELRALVLEQLAEREQKIARERLERGIQVLGRSRCLAARDRFLAGERDVVWPERTIP